MVRKKRASKRVSLKTKYKIQRKVAEHARKERRAAKKNPNRRSKKKDPGIPNLWPFKEQMLQKIEKDREMVEEEKAAQKEKRKKEKMKRRNQPSSMEKLAAAARKDGDAFESASTIADASAMTTWKNNNVKDSSMRAFYRDFKRVVDNAEVVLEILDARDPLGCRCPHVEESILRKDPNKKIILVLNKIDLVPREVTEMWLKYLRKDFPTIAFKSSTQSQRRNLSQSNFDVAKAPDKVLSSGECLGADTLLKLLKNYCRSADIKTSITVGLIGYPNVGKSSVINSLTRTKSCASGATPGLTRQAQPVHLDKNVKLLDCPGIVFASDSVDSDIILRNCINVQKLADPVEPVEAILTRCNSEQLMQLYEISEYSSTKEFLAQIAFKKGRLAKGGIPDYDKAARSVLQDWNNGIIPFYTLPPKERDTSQVTASIVSSWSKEFNVDEVFAEEQSMVIDALPSGEGQAYCAMVAGSAPEEFDMEGEGSGDDDSEVAAMEDAADAEEKPQLLLDGSRLTKSKGGKRVAREEVDELNPQRGAKQKRAQKELRRSTRKTTNKNIAAGAEEDMGDAAEAPQSFMYDFSTDFTAQPADEASGSDAAAME